VTSPVDQALRDRFIKEIDHNFSLIAPAGTGKTNSIAERILTIAERAPAKLDRLVVVTYTNKAAEEMRLRVRMRAVERKLDPQTYAALDEIFFGTIHAFCSRLLNAVGDRIGVRAGFEHLPDPERAWGEFLSTSGAKEFFARHEAELQELSRFVPVEDLLARLADGRVLERPPAEVHIPRAPDWEFLLSEEHVSNARKNSRPKVLANQQVVRSWGAASDAGDGFIPVPKCDGGGKDFEQAWQSVFEPFYSDLDKAADQLLAELSGAFIDWRAARGTLSFDDQLRLARRLFEDEIAREWIRSQEYSVILDEAQDTDPVQFDVLLQAAGSMEPTRQAPPEGRFAMVGDPQQSIYSGRADLRRYIACTDLLGPDAELSLSVTFRCSSSVIRSVNAIGPTLLDGQGGQADFVKLRARSGAPKGGVDRLVLAGNECDDSDSAEAEALAAWLVTQTPESLGARSWGEVAVILPRKAGLRPFHNEFVQQDLACQLHSETLLNHDSPAYAWFTALLTAMAEPENSWELYGILREVFGVPDSRMIDVGGLRIDQAPAEGSLLETELRLLFAARESALGLPLRDGVESIVQRLDLRGRLESLPDYDPDDLLTELERLLAVAGDAEAQRLTLGGWAEQLQTDLGKTRPGKEADPDAVQLIGGHKSKGSEWDVVIVPSLARDIYFPAGGEKFFSDYEADEEKSKRAERRRKETERLVYVTLTRARQRLVLVDDRAIRKRSGGVRFSYADLLTDGWLDGLPVVDRARQLQFGIESEPASETTRAPFSLPAADAVRAARRYLERRLPHELAHAAEPAESPDPERRQELEFPLDNPGIRYGTWWHEAMQVLPWGSGEEVCRARFETALSSCPTYDRGKEEGERLFASPLGAWLTGGKFVAHAELPFLRSTGELEAMQGVIDLAILDEEEWLILDWKTDRVEKLAQLGEQYAPQILAYADAVAAATGMPCSGGIWSTHHGEWLNLQGNCRHF